jgi:hypothetical protein
MASGVLIGFLKKQDADYIVLGDDVPIPLPPGLVLEQFATGLRVMIDYDRDSSGAMVVRSMKYSPGILPLHTR